MAHYLYEIIAIVIGVTIIAIGNIFIGPELSILLPIVNVVGGLVAVVPSLIIIFSKMREAKEIEDNFIIFIKDLTEGINSGMTLPVALKYLGRRDYGPLSKYVRDISAQVDWGIPFKTALENFSKRIKQAPIRRAITTIIETYRMGGKISDTLTAVGESLITINKIKRERAASVHGQILTNYLIYFVFIFILVVLQIFLVPILTPTQTGGMTELLVTPEAQAPISSAIYSQAFINFIIVQGLFAGLATGKMAEGSVVAGLKHSVLMIAFGYAIFSITSQIQIKIF
jgi:flagellar protein FlaJ